MHQGDRAEFDVQIAQLCAGFNVPLGDRPDAYFIGLRAMELPTFTRVVEYALGPDGPEKIPTSGQCWHISKKLRAQRSTFTQNVSLIPAWSGDHWDQKANDHLLAYMLRRYKAGSRYHPDARYNHLQQQVIAGPEGTERTMILVRWKNAWAGDIREADREGTRPEDHGQKWFEDCMRRAELQIDERMVA